MKKSLFLFMFLLGASMYVHAVSRSVEAAQALAVQHFAERCVGVSGKQYSPAAKPVLVYTQVLSDASETPAYYVFNEPIDGFVIISADDCAREVLGYSDEGSFDAEHIPSNVQFYLDVYAREIGCAKAHGVVRKPAKKAASYPAIGPLCTAKWDQDSPYNNLCPLLGSKRAYTGCVATAAAQVMYANQYPAQGIGSHSYTWNDKTLSANFGSTTYAWKQMLDSYSGNSTTAQKEAVATLMYHCGVACDMEYGTDASGAYSSDMARALVSYFGYDKGIWQLPKDYFSESQLLSIVSQDLQAGHTIMMGGATKKEEGHAFICDGMDTKGYLHINWGWSGAYDGYYQISALEPADQGIGGASSGLPFTEGVELCVNIIPDAGGNARLTPTADALEMTTSNTISNTSAATFRITELANCGLYAIDGRLAFGVYNEDGSWYGGATTTEEVGLDPWQYYIEAINVSVDLSSLSDGKYYLSLGVVQDKTYWPLFVYATGEKLYPFTVSGSTITFSESASEPDPEPIAASQDFTYLIVYDYDSKGYENNLTFFFETEDYKVKDDKVKGTLLYVDVFARSMTSIVGTYLIDGKEEIGSIWESTLLYGDGNTSAEKKLQSGYLTIAQDGEGNYLVSYDLYDTEGNNYSDNQHIIVLDNTLAGTYDNRQGQWVEYNLRNERVSAALPVSTTLTMIGSIDGTSKTLHNFFVEGVISSIKNTPAEMGQYGSCRLYLSEDGSEKNSLYGYNLRWLNDSRFTESAGKLLSEQDTIVVFGPLQNYNGTTPEVHGCICEHRPSSSSTGIDKSAQSVSEMPQKFLRDGRLYIRREKVIYDVLGKSAM